MKAAAPGAQLWRRGGCIYAPGGDRWWARRYATLPTALLLDERTLRLFFASIDDHDFGRIGYVDLDPRDPRRILREAREPILDLGPLGRFDDSGVNPSCALVVDGAVRLYYIGWQRCERVPYMLFAGLAHGRGDAPFEVAAPVPVLDRTAAEPFSRAAPFVLAEGSGYRMWYWSCLRWTAGPNGVRYHNVIRHLTSPDGVQWPDAGSLCLEPRAPDEYSVGRPWVVRDDDLYRMWYSIRGHREPYRLGYAESRDGLAWTRRDEAVGITRSAEGWDSEMLCYPCVVDAGGHRLLFYNGNRHGESGFGYAILEQD